MGCDAPAKGWQLVTDCPLCSHGPPTPGCGICGGALRFTLDRCPYSTVPRIFWRVVELVDLLSIAILPHAGGLLDQTATFYQAVQIAGSIRAKCQKEEEG